MSGVKRTKDSIDILEHAMQGVHMSENRERIVSFRSDAGIVGISSRAEVRELDEPTVEREVIVPMPRTPHWRRPR